MATAKKKRCDRENGSYDAGHDYQYRAARWSGEPLRICDSCGRTEAYYIDDLLFEIEMGTAPAMDEVGTEK